MCGIGGWIGLRAAAPPALERMAAAMRHRGPDGEGCIRFERAGLLCRRLALLDLAHGHQPVANETRTVWAVLNGEIYNHEALRRQLVDRGHRLCTRSDSELLPHLYEEWGAAFVRRLRGMFALAIYDAHAHEIFLARDPFGIKPLYVAADGERLVFASEARGLWASGLVHPEVDATSVWDYLSFGYVPEPATIWSGVRKLSPGHYLRFCDGTVDESLYAEPDLRPPPGPMPTLTHSAAEIEIRLRDSVRVHLAADVPVGAFLSSGVDSSLLVALASRERDLKTFSIGFEDGRGSHDERAAARAFAAAVGTEHHEEVVSARVYKELLPRVVAAQEEPLADPSASALWFLARAAGREVKAVLSGEGADELFGGYPIYQTGRWLRAAEHLPAPILRTLAGGARVLPNGLRGKAFLHRATTPLPEWFLGNAPLFTEDEKRRLFASTFGGAFPRASSELVAPHYMQLEHDDPVVRMQTLACRTWLPSNILAKADKMGMAHSLEIRVPFLDAEVLPAAAMLPLAQRVGRKGTKVALRAAAERLLPHGIARRPKLGFPVPFRAWLDGDLERLLCELVTSSRDHLLDRTAVMGCIAEPRRRDRHRRLWALLVYLLWVETSGVSRASR